MKKLFAATALTVAVGLAAPASAADLAARPYTKAPPMVAAIDVIMTIEPPLPPFLVDMRCTAARRHKIAP